MVNPQQIPSKKGDKNLSTLERELQRSLHFQELARLELQWDDSPGGPILGLHDWMEEERLIRKEIYGRFPN